MNVKILKTKKEYEDACERIYNHIQNTDNYIEPNTPEGEEIELLSLLIEKYEQENYPLDAPNPIEAIKFRMEQMNLKQSDIAPLFGGKTRVSEVLNGRRPLSLNMITLLNEYLGIPFELLVNGNCKFKLEPEKKEKLLNVASIREYLIKNKKIAIL